ncbi:MAG: prolipoprotein diacylglyceryl transferase [Gemmatimonadota bacterium]|nr:prolipoprotein diacylglyceryl transferase [Gemmatimonadota bacterium]
MRRVLFYWRGRPIHSYPAMLYIGLVAGVVAGNYAAHVSGLDAFRVYVASIALIIPSLAGARLLHVAAHWKVYRRDRARIWDLSEGGMAQYGGLVLGVPLSVPLLSALELPFGAFWDIGSFTMLVGMIFTRFGCLLNGCCSGRPFTGWGSLYLPNHAGVWERRVPTQLLEAGWATMLLVSSMVIWQRLPFQGALFLFVVGGYSCGRLILASLRDLRAHDRRFTIQHAISLLLIVLSLAALTGQRSMNG